MPQTFEHNKVVWLSVYKLWISYKILTKKHNELQENGRGLTMERWRCCISIRATEEHKETDRWKQPAGISRRHLSSKTRTKNNCVIRTLSVYLSVPSILVRFDVLFRFSLAKYALVILHNVNNMSVSKILSFPSNTLLHFLLLNS